MVLVPVWQISQFLILRNVLLVFGSVSPTWCPGFLQCCALGLHASPRSVHFPQAAGKEVLFGGCWFLVLYGVLFSGCWFWVLYGVLCGGFCSVGCAVVGGFGLVAFVPAALNLDECSIASILWAFLNKVIISAHGIPLILFSSA